VPVAVRRQLAPSAAAAIGRRDLYAAELAATADSRARVLVAHWARLVVDLNRSGAVTDVDLTAIPEHEDERLVRVYDDHGQALWRSALGRPPLTRAELETRVQRYYLPYHRALAAALLEAGRPCLLVDLHTMEEPVLDLVIGDCRGHSAGVDLCEGRLVPFFLAAGLRVAYAGPRATDRQGRPVPAAAVRQSGGFITGRYGDPTRGVYAVQFEFSRRSCRQDLAPLQQILTAFWAFAVDSLLAGRQSPGVVAGAGEDG
jgi:N-formylglutamate deformylase